MGRRSDENAQKVVIDHALDRLCLLAGNGQSQVCGNLDCQYSHGRPVSALLRSCCKRTKQPFRDGATQSTASRKACYGLVCRK